MTTKFDELIRKLVEEGIPVILQYNSSEKKMYADLSFQAKSHGHLYETENGLEIRQRYGDVTEIEDFQDILRCFMSCYRYRDFGSETWLELCEKHGLISRKTTTTVTTKWE